MQEPHGDRHWIETYPILQKMADYEKQTGIEFTHIRLLARSMSDRSLSLSNLTMGSNQRMEFLGDTVLQLVTSDYLYKHFPEHHEGHLSLLRSSIVNNRTQVKINTLIYKRIMSKKTREMKYFFVKSLGGCLR